MRVRNVSVDGGDSFEIMDVPSMGKRYRRPGRSANKVSVSIVQCCDRMVSMDMRNAGWRRFCLAAISMMVSNIEGGYTREGMDVNRPTIPRINIQPVFVILIALFRVINITGDGNVHDRFRPFTQ